MIRPALILLCLASPALAQDNSAPIGTFSAVTGSATTFDVGCEMARLPAGPPGDVEISWDCVERYAAKAKARGYTGDMTEAAAVLMKAVRDGKFKEMGE